MCGAARIQSSPYAAGPVENETLFAGPTIWCMLQFVRQSLGVTIMDSLPENAQASAIITRAKGILMDPAAEWAKIATETDPPKQVFLRYALPLALISPLASLIGGQLFGLGGFGISLNLSLTAGLTIAVVSFVLSLVSLWVIAFVANFLSPKFGGRDDFPAAFRLIAYSWTAAWLVGIFGLIPMLGILGIIGLYSLYLLYKGAGPVMGVPQDKATGYTVVTIVAAIVAMFAVQLVVGLFTAPLLMAGMSGASDQISVDMGENGSMVSNADGTMTITGPDGEEMTITMDGNQPE